MELKGVLSFEATLIKKIKDTHDSDIFVFELPDKKMFIGGHGSVVCIKGPPTIGGKKYTPIKIFGEPGTFDVLIKIYHPCTEFPNGGKFTTWLDKQPIGTKFEMISKLKKKVVFHPGGKVYLGKQKREATYNHIGMIAGGSGITPMVQAIQYFVENSHEKMKLTLIFSNKTKEDILMKKQLDEYNASGKVQVIYTLTRNMSGWDGVGGRVTKDMITKYFGPINNDLLVIYCGPKDFNKAMINILEEAGIKKENYTKV